LRLLLLGLGLGLGLANFSLGLGLGGHTVDVEVLFILNIFIMRSPVGPMAMEGEIIDELEVPERGGRFDSLPELLRNFPPPGAQLPYRNSLGEFFIILRIFILGFRIFRIFEDLEYFKN